MLNATNIDGSVDLQCHIVGYEFPDSPEDDWCMIRLAVRHRTNSFEKVDPALEASDLLAIRDWFHSLAQDRLPRFANLSFTEPCLSFEFLARDAHGVRFAVQLDAELRPSFPLNQLSVSSNEWNVVFHFTPDELTSVVTAIEASIKRFPVRSRSSKR